MALSGSFNTSGYEGRYLTLSWTATQSIADNKSTIKWTLKGAGEGQAGYYMAGSFKVVIAGETVYSSATRIQLYNGTTVASGTKVITHNTDGSKSFSASAQAAIYLSSVNCSGSGNWTLNTIPRGAEITTSSDFNDEQNVTFKYNNPAGNNVTSLQACISLDGSTDDIKYRGISKTGTTYTLELTSGERTILRKAVTGSNTRKVGIYLKTVIDGNTFYKSSWVNFTVINGAPTLSPVVEDINETSSLYTQDPTGTVIKGFNTMRVATNATAAKEATIVSQSITCGKQKINGSGGTMNNVESATFVFTATDSRGNTITKTITNKLINYVPLTCNITVTPPTTSGVSTITIEGNYFKGSLGAVDNSLGINYRYALTTDEYAGILTTNATVSGNTYKATVTVSGLNYQKAYKFQAIATDLLDIKYSTSVVVRTEPLFDWGWNDFAFNVPISIEGNPLADFVIETGTASMGSNGTWYWRKWASGRAECVGCRNFGNMAVSTAWGEALFMSDTFTQELPDGLFSYTPDYIDISINRATGYNGFIIGSSATEASKSTTSSFRVCRGSAATMQQVYINFNVIGRWK